jgi:PEP-CTERM motif
LAAYTSGSTGVQGSGSDITSLTFSLTDGGDFERFVMNIDAVIDGSVLFSVLEPNGDLFEDSFFVDGTGQNFFTFTAINGQSIESVTLTGLSGLSISSVTTVRIGPIEATAVPEPASWAMMLLGFGAVGFAARRRKHMDLTLSRAF